MTGHTLRKALGVIAVLRGQAAAITVLAQQAGTPELAGSVPVLRRGVADGRWIDLVTAAGITPANAPEASVTGRLHRRPGRRRPVRQGPVHH